MGGEAERGLEVLAGVVELGADILLCFTVCGQLSLRKYIYIYISLYISIYMITGFSS